METTENKAFNEDQQVKKKVKHQKNEVNRNNGEKWYVQITEQSAQILLKILELESQEVTTTRLTEILGFKVNDFITEAEQDSRQFLAFNDWSSVKAKKTKQTTGRKGQGGRHTEILEIRPNRIVTHPVSAAILLELAKFSEKNREVNRRQFIEHLLANLAYLNAQYSDFSKEFLEERIQFLLKIGDIHNDETVPNVIWIDWIRHHSQKAFLRLLTEQKLVKPPQSA